MDLSWTATAVVAAIWLVCKGILAQRSTLPGEGRLAWSTAIVAGVARWSSATLIGLLLFNGFVIGIRTDVLHSLELVRRIEESAVALREDMDRWSGGTPAWLALWLLANLVLVLLAIARYRVARLRQGVRTVSGSLTYCLNVLVGATTFTVFSAVSQVPAPEPEVAQAALDAARAQLEVTIRDEWKVAGQILAAKVLTESLISLSDKDRYALANMFDAAEHACRAPDYNRDPTCPILLARRFAIWQGQELRKQGLFERFGPSNQQGEQLYAVIQERWRYWYDQAGARQKTFGTMAIDRVALASSFVPQDRTRYASMGKERDEAVGAMADGIAQVFVAFGPSTETVARAYIGELLEVLSEPLGGALARRFFGESVEEKNGMRSDWCCEQDLRRLDVRQPRPFTDVVIRWACTGLSPANIVGAAFDASQGDPQGPRDLFFPRLQPSGKETPPDEALQKWASDRRDAWQGKGSVPITSAIASRVRPERGSSSTQSIEEERVKSRGRETSHPK